MPELAVRRGNMDPRSSGFRHWGHGQQWPEPAMGRGIPWFNDRPPFHHDAWHPPGNTPRWEMQTPPVHGFPQSYDHSRVKVSFSYSKPGKLLATKEYIEGLLLENCGHINKPGTNRKLEDNNFFKKPNKKRFFTPVQPASLTEVAKNTDAQTTETNKKSKVEECNPTDKISQANKEAEPSVYVAPGIVYSCKPCEFETPDESEFQKHLNSSWHSEIIKHLNIFLPKERVRFLEEYILFENSRVSKERRRLNLQPRKDSFKGIGQEHFFHRVEVAHCRACDSFVADVPELLAEHVKSESHIQKCKITSKEIKSNCLTVAKALLQDTYVLHLLNHYNKGQGLSTYKEKATAHVGNHEVLVAEEDDVSEDEPESGRSEIVDTTEDPISVEKGPAQDLPNSSPEVKKSSSSDVNNVSELPIEDVTVNDEEAAEAP